MTDVFVAVSKGVIEAHVDLPGGDRVIHEFAGDRSGAARFHDYMARLGVTEVSTSSSIDFPEEFGSTREVMRMFFPRG